MEEYELPEQPHRCLCCGNDMSYGRPDRKFCSQTCKDQYHNSRRTNSKLARFRVDSILEKNYSILNNLLKMGISQVPRPDIIAMGFNPDFMTHAGVGKTTICEYACYDIAYRISDARVFNIHRMSLNLRQINKVK